jgi:hypothetical protein
MGKFQVKGIKSSLTSLAILTTRQRGKRLTIGARSEYHHLTTVMDASNVLGSSP